MKTTIQKTMWLCMVALALTACSKDEGNSEPKAEKGYATGKVIDGQGKPIAGAKILLDNLAFYDSRTEGVTDEKGTYKIKIVEGSWKAYANFKTIYNGKTYSIQAYPDDSSVLGADGGVRNFTWKLKGVDPDNNSYFYGGRIIVHTDNDFEEDREDIELTFMPNSPLIDGSQGKTIKVTYGDHYWVEYGYIYDFPVGRYNVTAILKKGGSNVPLKIQNWHTQGNFESELQLDFLPDNSDFRPTTEASIVIGY